MGVAEVAAAPHLEVEYDSTHGPLPLFSDVICLLEFATASSQVLLLSAKPAASLSLLSLPPRLPSAASVAPSK